MNMEKEKTMEFFTNISHIIDQLTRIVVVVDEDDLIQTIVDGNPPSWEIFLASINGRDEQTNFESVSEAFFEASKAIENLSIWMGNHHEGDEKMDH